MKTIDWNVIILLHSSTIQSVQIAPYAHTFELGIDKNGSWNNDRGKPGSVKAQESAAQLKKMQIVPRARMIVEPV